MVWEMRGCSGVLVYKVVYGMVVRYYYTIFAPMA